ncbi:MAG: YraN family protein [Candidatus Aminicenantes bacterium]|jgi:putative endonuclease|nr:YraN family protein [Candidatus Aminicenantes bacterium]
MIKRQLSPFELGKLGEDYALEYLQNKKFHILEKSFRFYRGEIDIIAFDRDTLVFVEVKTRHHSDRVTPEEAITPKKQQQIRRIAHAYVSIKNLENQKCRFDVLALRYDDVQGFHVIHYTDAF